MAKAPICFEHLVCMKCAISLAITARQAVFSCVVEGEHACDAGLLYLEASELWLPSQAVLVALRSVHWQKCLNSCAQARTVVTLVFVFQLESGGFHCYAQAMHVWGEIARSLSATRKTSGASPPLLETYTTNHDQDASRLP